MATLRDRARRAAERGAWDEAMNLFARLDSSALETADLDAMADAAWWGCRLDQSIAIRQKAYDAYLATRDERGAGRAAWKLSVDFGIKGEAAAGSGWLKRAQRHLAAHQQSVERGFLAITESEVALAAGDFEQARASAQLAADLGERCSSLDLHAMGIQTLGRNLIASGEISEGMSLLDEAMALVSAERLSPLYTGWIYCNVVATCMERADIERAAEWTEAAMSWCSSISELTPYHGICRMHSVEITAMRGDWERAKSDALRAADEMQGLEQHVVAEAFYAIGEISLRRGDLPMAEEWFIRAQTKGRDPQPGLAFLRLAQGNSDAASVGLQCSLASAASEPALHRARLLAAQVDVAMAANDLDMAKASVRALKDIALRTRTTLLEALLETAQASFSLAVGQVEQTLQHARHAWSLWQQLRSPYDAARARTVIGLAAKAIGDTDRAQIELEAARAAFERLGAGPKAREAAEHLGETTNLPGGLSARELEVLRLVAAGKTNREIAAEMVISQHTVSRHLQNIFRKLGVPSRAAATAFAFEHSLV